MSARKLLEGDVNLILAEIKAKMPAALAAVRADRLDPKVTTEKPESYFTFERAQGFKTPAIFVIGEDMDFRQAERGANHINALSTVNVSVLVEERNQELLTKKVYRYCSALHEILEQANLSSDDGKLQIFVRVAKMEMSAIYTDSDNPNDPRAVFRKEAFLALNVDHIENY